MSSHKEQLAASKKNVPALSIVSASTKVSTNPTSPESCVSSYIALIADLKQKLSDAHDLIDNQVSTINTLRNDITCLEETKVELSNENDQISNDILDIIEESKEIKLMFERTAKEKRVFQQENKLLVREISIMEDKLEKKREQILDHDELNELVKIVQQPIKQTLKQCVSEKRHLELSLKGVQLEKDSLCKVMDVTTKEMENIIQDQDKKIQFLKSQIIIQMMVKEHDLESISAFINGEREKKQEIDSIQLVQKENDQTYPNKRTGSVMAGGCYWFYCY